MNLKNYRYVVNQFFTTLIDNNSNYTKYTREGQTYTELLENEKIHGGVYYWLNVTNNKNRVYCKKIKYLVDFFLILFYYGLL